MNLTYGFLSWLPENYWRRSLRQIFANGILEAEARQATKLFLGPVIFGGLLAIIIPALVAWAAIQLFGKSDHDLNPNTAPPEFHHTKALSSSR